MTRFMFTFAAVFFLFAQPLMALTLDEAKLKGYLGETPSGYLEAVTSESPAEARAVMQDINAKRRAEYTAIAQKNGTSVAAVEALAGKKALDKSGSGEYVKVNGSWIKK